MAALYFYESGDFMKNKYIDENLAMLEQELNEAKDSFKNLKVVLTEAKETDNADLADFSLRQRDIAREEYSKTREDYNDTLQLVSKLKIAYESTEDPKILKNLKYQEAKLKELKGEKSNLFWDKVYKGRKYKEEKAKRPIVESLEYDNLQKLMQALDFISTTQYGRITINGEQTDEQNPAGITQSAEEFEQSLIGTEIEYALYYSYTLGPGYFIITGITGEEEPHIAYFYEENNKFKVIDPQYGELYDPKYVGKNYVIKDKFEQVVKLYTKNTVDFYQVFENIDFLIGQPISLFQDLIVQNWSNGLLELPSPLDLQAEEETSTVEQSEVEQEQIPKEQVAPEQIVQENMLFWHEAAEDSSIPNNNASITKTNLANDNLEAKEDVIENKKAGLNQNIERVKEQINQIDENIENINNQLENNTNPASGVAAKARIKSLEKQKALLNKKIQDYEKQDSSLTKDKKELADQQESIQEAKSPVELAFSGRVGAIYNYIVTGQSTGDPNEDYLANKAKDSAVIKNILYKYDRELNKVNPDSAVISSLKLRLKSELNKFKKTH